MYYVLFSDHYWCMTYTREDAEAVVKNYHWDGDIPEGLRWWKIFHCYERKMWEEVLTNL